MALNDIKDLKGMELAMLSVAFGFNEGPKQTKDNGDGKPREWYRALVYNGIVFTLPESDYKKYEAGEAHTIRLQEVEREIDDPQDASKKIKVPSWSFVKLVTHEVYDNLRNAEVKDQFRADFIKADIAAKAKGLDLASAKI